MRVDEVVIRLALTNPGAHKFHLVASWRGCTLRFWPSGIKELQVFGRFAAAGRADFLTGAVRKFVGTLCNNCIAWRKRISTCANTEVGGMSVIVFGVSVQ